MNGHDWRMRCNVRIWLRYVIYFAYFYVLYLLITRLQFAFPNVEQSPPIKPVNQDTRSLSDTLDHMRLVTETESTDPNHDDDLKFVPAEKASKRRDITDTDLITYPSEMTEKDREEYYKERDRIAAKKSKSKKKSKKKKGKKPKPAKRKEKTEDTDTINVDTSDTQPLVLTRSDYTTEDSLQKVAKNIRKNAGNKKNGHDEGDENDDGNESKMQHMTARRDGDDDSDESDDTTEMENDTEWARTDTDLSYTSDTDIIETRVFEELSLQYFDHYDKYIQNRSILEIRPENIFEVPKLTFLPNLRNPCFLVKNDHTDIMRGQPPSQRDIDYLPGLTLKCLPYFFVCATEKSGTSDLYMRLDGHQSINFAFWKEIYFFNGQAIRFNRKRIRFNFGGYFNVFREGHGMIYQCLQDKFESANNKMLLSNNITCPDVLCDATPRYLHSDFGGLDVPNQLAPHKIKHLLGDRPKLIMMFRNPTDRLLSDYRYFERQKGRGKQTSAEEFHMRALSAEKTFNKCVKRYSERQCVYKYDLEELAKEEKNIGFNNVIVMSRMCIGMYVVFLETWFSVFPRENFHIVLFEEYIKNPNQYIQKKILPFLGLEEYDKEAQGYLDEINNEIINKSPDQTKPKRMWNETRVILNRVYKPYNERLAKLLKDDRFLWKE